MNKCAGVAFIQTSWVHVKLHISYKTIKLKCCRVIFSTGYKILQCVISNGSG